MTQSPRLGRVWLVLLALVFCLLPTERAEAVIFFDVQIERPIDLTVAVGSGRFGIAEEHKVRICSGSWESREVLSVGTAIHFGSRSVTVPTRLSVLIVVSVGLCLVALILTSLSCLARRWKTKHLLEKSEQSQFEES